MRRPLLASLALLLLLAGCSWDAVGSAARSWCRNSANCTVHPELPG